MKAMIFAAGLGSRLKPLTNSKPKALVEVGNKTLLQLNIEQILTLGIKEIVVNVHHFSDQVISYLKNNNNFGVDIRISNESELLLDTGGGLKKASALLKGTEPVLLQNVDIYSTIDYVKLLRQHIESKALATLAIQNRVSSRYLMFDTDWQLSGWLNTRSKEKIITRNSPEIENYAFSGIHIISPQILDMLPSKDVFGIIEAYLELSKSNRILGYLHNSDDWFDVGTPEKLEKLNMHLQ
jgi:NDP-sugar pyrophosphorylase family protein